MITIPTQELFYMTAGISALIVALWKTHKIYRDTSWENRNKVIVRTWIFCTLIVVTALISSSESYVSMSEWTGINNINWLVTYLFTSLALYIMSDGLNIILNARTPKAVHAAIVLEWAILISLFFTGISDSHLAIDHVIAKNMRELLFMEIAYFYIAVMCFYTITQMTQLIYSGRELSTRIRWQLSTVSPVFATLFFTARFVYVPIIYLWPEWDNMVVHDAIGFVFVLASITWPIFYLPNSVFTFISHPFVYINNLITLQDLNFLQREIDKVCPRIVRQHEPLLKQLLKLDMYIYRAIISILDGKQILNSYRNDDLSSDLIALGNGRFLQSAPQPLHGHIYETLQAVDDSNDYPFLVAQYRAIARAYRKEAKA